MDSPFAVVAVVLALIGIALAGTDAPDGSVYSCVGIAAILAALYALTGRD